MSETSGSGETADQTSARSDRATRILLDVMALVTTTGSTRRALKRLAELALEATGADRCAILTPDPNGAPRLLPGAAATRIGDPAELWPQFRAMEPIEVEADPERLALWESTEAVAIEDVSESTLVPNSWRARWGSKSLAFAVLKADGEHIGLLAADYVEATHRFSREELSLLGAIASGAAIALRDARLVEQLRVSVDVEQRLGECVAALRAGLPLHELLDLIADGVSSLLPRSSCAINLLSSDQATIRTVVWRGIPPKQAELHLIDFPAADVSQMQSIWTADPRTPIVVPNVWAHKGWENIIPPSIDTAMLVPLSDGSEVLGFIGIGRKSKRFTDEEVRVAQAFADQAAQAVSQARLTDLLQRQLQVVEALYRLSDKVVRRSDLRRAISVLNNTVGVAIGLRCSRLALRDEALAKLLKLPRASGQERERIKAWHVDRRFDPQRVGEHLAVPVWIGRRPVGILWLRSQAPLDASELELAKAIAAGLGEVANKVKLRHTADERAREVAIGRERDRIARHLQDTVGQSILEMGLALQEIVRQSPKDSPLRPRLEELATTATRTLIEIRQSVYASSLVNYRTAGLIPSLRTLVQEFSNSTGIWADLRVRSSMPPLSDEAQAVVYRLVHEVLASLAPGGRATGVVIVIEDKTPHLMVSIRDDGVGMDQRQIADWRSSPRLNMRLVAKQVDRLGGRLSISPVMPRGLVVQCLLPITDAELISLS